MGSSDSFELKEAIDNWEKSNFSQKELIASDKAEFKDHILNSIDELLENDLSEEEAFTIAKMRFGNREDWAEEMQIMNEDNLQLKKIVLLISGILLFIFSYKFILCINRIILLWSNYYSGDVVSGVENSKVFFNIIYVLSISTMVALYFLHEPIKWLLKHVILNTKLIILFILVFIIVVGAERFLAPQVRNSIDDRLLKDAFFNIERYFDYFYFLIICIGYLAIFKRFSKKYNSLIR